MIVNKFSIELHAKCSWYYSDKMKTQSTLCIKMGVAGHIVSNLTENEKISYDLKQSNIDDAQNLTVF